MGMMTNCENKPAKRSRFFSFLLRTVLPLALGIGILWLVFKDTDFKQMGEMLGRANFGILALSLLFGGMANAVRALRWRLLLTPLGHRPRRLNLISAVYGGYAVNFIIPRAGELWRCGMVTKTEKIPFAQSVSTMLLDRILDFFSMTVIVLLALSLNAEIIFSQLSGGVPMSEKLIQLASSVWFWVALLVFGVVAWFVWRFRNRNKLIIRIKNLIRGLWNDLCQIARMKQKMRLISYSVLIWAGYFFYFYVALLAFDFTAHLGFTAGLIAFTMGSIGMLVPTNGGMGAWHAAIIGTLTLYGVEKTEAHAFAFSVFAIQSLWFIALGLIGIIGLSLTRQKS